MPLHIGLLVFPHVQQLDLTAPYDVFASMPDTVVHLLWKDLAPLRSSTGLTLTPDTRFADCPPLDVLCVPGGIGINALLEDDETLDFIRRHAQTVRYLTSVCTGALVLGAAGLLHGRRATTHWVSQPLLAAFGAQAAAQRVVHDGNLITGGGVTAGIDFALSVAAALLGDDVAQSLQLELEYAPAPPFNAGRPDTAPRHIVDAVRRQAAPGFAVRENIIARVTAAAAPTHFR